MYLKFSAYAFCLLFGLALGFSACSTTPEEKPPNFVFFLVDDLGWTDLGCFGSSFYETPNIDRLAATGVRFTNAYAANPVCSPTRASILTGKHPTRLPITTWIDSDGNNQPDQWDRNTPLLPAPYLDRLPHEEVTIAEALKEAGYATFFAGKWHLGPEGFWPEDQGFDVNKGGITRGGPYGGNQYFSPYGNPRLEDGPEGEHLPDRLASETVKFIEDNQEKPFLAYLSFYSVHTPLMAREDLKAKYEAKQATAPETEWGQELGRKVRLVQNHAVYAGMVEAMDQAVGKVLDHLDELGLADNTVVFFMSDNGGLSTSEGHPTSNLPLRGGKGWLYEGGIREPMVIRWPGVADKGETEATPVISMDFYPTMLEMAGLNLRPEQHLDGHSLTPLLRHGSEPSREALFWHYPHYGNQGGRPGVAIRQGDYKLIEFYENGHAELYNLAEDIDEQNDLREKEPERTEQMRRRLHQWMESVEARPPSPNPNFDNSGPRYE